MYYLLYTRTHISAFFSKIIIITSTQYSTKLNKTRTFNTYVINHAQKPIGSASVCIKIPARPTNIQNIMMVLFPLVDTNSYKIEELGIRKN